MTVKELKNKLFIVLLAQSDRHKDYDDLSSLCVL